MEKTAATELKKGIQRTTGSLTSKGKNAVVHIGDTAFARSKNINVKQMPAESWIVKNFDNHVVIAGGGSRGTLYGVWHFLEDFIGMRFWNHDEEYLPPKKDRNFNKLDASGKPFFAMREVYTGPNIPKVSHVNYLRNRLNQMKNSFSISKE